MSDQETRRELARIRAIHARDHQAGRHDGRYGIALCPVCPDVDGDEIREQTRSAI